MIIQESLSVPLAKGVSLHLRHIYHEQKAGPVVLFLHGAIENGKIFYTESNKGLAPYMALNGFNCFVLDLRGRGGSLPLIDAGHDYGQTESILEDVPAALQFIEQNTGKKPQFWVAHSWGGVIMNSVFARFPHEIQFVDACAYFGSKRSLYNNHPEKLLKANLMWYWLANYYSKKHGYLPARKLKWGSDNETVKSHWQSAQWAKKQPWIDSDDNFDYAKALESKALPPTLHIAGVNDKALAQPIDIKMFMKESGVGIQSLNIYGKRYGHAHNYGHIDMLTHPKAQGEQFKDLLKWFELHRK
ncbi:alpha/beta fold hydrolase [Pseudoalteromonas luteoviolacea]|uniref:alpha/beta fold hydrolase n=1 Tax=Pseudoalteromonas luteoviolacea TaxID=43657 RepID=UPI001B397342|nr:alpha/beta fold hydrolase [Pseudoalteromonas luteoviolacea]MBQ4810759.1 alpha/beta fold hydrolase [Pseudoalteromonas luteoviolacea]